MREPKSLVLPLHYRVGYERYLRRPYRVGRFAKTSSFIVLPGFRLVHNGERELFEFDRQIDFDDADCFWDGNRYGGKIYNAMHPGLNEQVGHFLGKRSRDGDQRQANFFFRDDTGCVTEKIRRHVVNWLRHFCRVTVKRGGDAKALVSKSSVAQQGSTQVTDADEGNSPVLVGAQNPFDRRDQFVTAITNSGVAERAKVGQIFSDLGIGKPKPVAEVAGAGCFLPVAKQMLQFSQV